MPVTCVSTMPEAYAPMATGASSTMTSRHTPHPSSRICQADAHLLPCQSVHTVGLHCPPASNYCMPDACVPRVSLVGSFARHSDRIHCATTCMSLFCLGSKRPVKELHQVNSCKIYDQPAMSKSYGFVCVRLINWQIRTSNLPFCEVK